MLLLLTDSKAVTPRHTIPSGTSYLPAVAQPVIADHRPLSRVLPQLLQLLHFDSCTHLPRYSTHTHSHTPIALALVLAVCLLFPQLPIHSVGTVRSCFALGKWKLRCALVICCRLHLYTKVHAWCPPSSEYILLFVMERLLLSPKLVLLPSTYRLST